MRHHANGNVDVYNSDAEHEDREGKGGCDACKDGQGYSDDEKEGDNEAVDRVEESHDELMVVWGRVDVSHGVGSMASSGAAVNELAGVVSYGGCLGLKMSRCSR